MPCDCDKKKLCLALAGAGVAAALYCAVKGGPCCKKAATPSAPSHNYTLNTNDTQRALYNALKDLKPIPELKEPKKVAKYEEAPMEKVLYPIVDENDVIIVAGAFFGDEGKGKSIDAIARHPKCNVICRTNSGENAGHTVFDSKGRKFIFHLAPSGLLLPGKRNFVGAECVMDPISFMEKEVSQLARNGVPYDNLFIGNVHIVTPYHKLLDMLVSAPNSSTLKGMSPIHASKVTKRGIRLDHIFNSEKTLRARLAKDMDTYYGVLKVKNMSDADVMKRCEMENSDGVKRIPDHVMDFVKADDKIQYLIDMYRTRVRDNKDFPKRCDVAHEIRKELEAGNKVLLEGPQSYWLSNAREKFWESSTSADTTAGGLVATAQYNFQKYKSIVINVHKAPATSRVGIGANPCAYVPQDYFSAQNVRTLRDLHEDMCKDFDPIQAAYCKAVKANGILEPVEFTDSTGTYNIGVAMTVASSRHHGESGATTLKPRICGLFDCVLQYEVGSAQGPYLSISALDRGDSYDKVGLTIAYVYHSATGETVNCGGKVYKNGDIIRAGDQVPGEAALFHCHPIIKMVDGWKSTPLAASEGRKPGDPLPAGVCQFIATVEHFTKSKVLSIGNGPIGSNIIYLKQ